MMIDCKEPVVYYWGGIFFNLKATVIATEIASHILPRVFFSLSASQYTLEGQKSSASCPSGCYALLGFLWVIRILKWLASHLPVIFHFWSMQNIISLVGGSKEFSPIPAWGHGRCFRMHSNTLFILAGTMVFLCVAKLSSRFQNFVHIQYMLIPWEVLY